jgi:uncharacterized membrane protein
VLWVGTVLCATLLTIESVQDHHAFGTSFDLAHYDQMLWLLSRGKEPFSTIVTRPMLADHFQPGVVLLAPLYWVGLGVPALLAAQAAAVALTAPALFALARAAGASPAQALIPALMWLICPWMAAPPLFDFHPIAFLPLLLVLSVWAAIRERHVLLLVTALLALGLKEDVALTYVMLGLLLVLRGQRRIGGLLAGGSALWVAGASVVLRSSGAAYENYERRFAGDRGDSVADAGRWIVLHPLDTVVDVSRQSLWGLALVLLSTACLALLAPTWMLLALPTVAHNAFSAYAPQHDLLFHYHLGTLSALFIAAAVGVRRVDSLRRWARIAVGAAAIIAASIAVIGGRVVHESPIFVVPEQQAAARLALDRIPSTAPVAATLSLLPHLSRRVEVYSLPEPFSPVDWGSTLSPGEFARRARHVRFVAYRDGDILPTGGFTSPDDVVSALPMLHRLGFVEIAHGGRVHVLTRR